MSLKAPRAFLLFLLFFIVIVALAWVLAPYWSNSASGSGTGHLALLHIEGVISGGSGGGGLLGGEAGASAITICDRLYSALEDDSIKGVVLRINSPGGSAAASDEIFRAVRAVSAQKPVVVSMGDVAASGGYYIASGADYICANGATLTGSIGVVFNLLNWEEAAGKLGIEDMTLTAGQYKDIGSPWREMTADERAMLTDLMTEVHDQFIAAVAEGRANLDEEQVRALATGMIYTGERALEVGLIDELGGLRAAETKARELAGVGEDTPVMEFREPSFFEQLFAIEAPASPELAALRRLAADPLLRFSQGLCLNTTLRDLVVR
ncbi:signal peptide peptidase SppA [bacterium]|nr:signal peptide peptidase SppA [bacterium]